MDTRRPETKKLPGIVTMIILGILLISLGIPFLGMTIMTIFLLRELQRGIAPALAVLICVFLLSDFTSALIAAVGSGLFVSGIKMKWDRLVVIGLVSVVVSGISLFRVLLFPETFPFIGEEIALFLNFYRGAGLTEKEIMSGLHLILNIFPALLFIWGTIGTLVASVGIHKFYARREKVVFKASEPFRLGLFPAWILILCLLVYALQTSLPAFAMTAAMNIVLYVFLLYCFVGMIILTRFLNTFPLFVLPVVVLAVFALPIILITATILGIFDTWFDFRNKIKLRIERKLTQ